jgi:hypothetical protein
LKWVEVNVRLPNEISRIDFFMETIKPLVLEVQNKFTVKSWHFLWEEVPYSSTLRLRFLVETENVGSLKSVIEDVITDFEYCFGSHGNCGKEYGGEASGWGVKGWERGVELLQFGSEFAMELMDKKESLGVGNEYKKSGYFFADRYVHLFLNQLEPLLIEKDGVGEAHFVMCEGVYRYALQYINSKYGGSVSDADKIAGKIVKEMVEASKKKIEEQVDALISKV